MAIMHWIAFALPALASAAVLEERQLPSLLGSILPAASLAGVDELKPRIRTGARRTLTKIGPLTIKGATGGKGVGDSTLGGQSFFGQITKGICNNQGGVAQDCTMLAGRVGIQWADGREATPASGLYIHHILSSNTNKKETPWLSNCNTPTRVAGNVNGITGGAGFLSTGEDSAADSALYTDSKGNLNTGYHIKATDKFNYWAQLVNYNKEPAKVYLTFDQEWLPGLVGQDTKVMVVSATCGAGRVRMLESGPVNTTSGRFSIMEDGRIMGARGHIHDGGVAMHMLINDKYVCSSEAKYGYRGADAGGMGGMSHGGHGHRRRSADPPAADQDKNKGILTVASMTDCEGPFKVKKGDTVVLKGEYDLKKHPLRVSAGGSKASGVMAMMGVLFSPGLGPITMLNGTVVP